MTRTRLLLPLSCSLAILAAVALFACSSAHSSRPTTAVSASKSPEIHLAARPAAPISPASSGIASWYGPGFEGNLTANGEIYDTSQLTAAHQTLPFNTLLRVTALDSGRSVIVRINDRFPGTKGRVIDLSPAAFERLAPLSQGLVEVRLEVLPSR